MSTNTDEVWPIEKLRRSTVDWNLYVPEMVAKRQVSYELDATAYAMRLAGFKLRDIAAKFGVTKARAGHRIVSHKRKLLKLKHNILVSPAEIWFTECETPFIFDAPHKPVRDWLIVSRKKIGD